MYSRMAWMVVVEASNAGKSSQERKQSECNERMAAARITN